MTFPPLTTILAMYAINVGILWTATRFLAPAENKPTVLRCLAAAFVMTFFGNASHKFLNPLIGNWDILVKFLAFVIAAMAIFKLSFWRSGLVGLCLFVAILPSRVWRVSRLIEVFPFFRSMHRSDCHTRVV